MTSVTGVVHRPAWLLLRLLLILRGIHGGLGTYEGLGELKLVARINVSAFAVVAIWRSRVGSHRERVVESARVGFSSPVSL